LSNLEYLGFTKEEIDNLVEKEGIISVRGIVNRFDNTKKIFDKLKEIGINDVKNIIFVFIDLFFMDYEDFLDILNKKDLEKFVKEVNENPEEITSLILDD